MDVLKDIIGNLLILLKLIMLSLVMHIIVILDTDF